MRRREFLRGAATAAVGSTALASRAAAVHDTEGQPSHVTLTFNQSSLEVYQPKLVTGHLEVRPTKQYAWKASSPEQDDDVYTYWTYYVTQQGFTPRDSHILDREPCFVFVNEDTGEISEVIYSAYHWLAGRTHTPSTYEDSTGVHPTFRVAKTWHHYLQTTETSGVFVDLEDMSTVFDEWLANGWEDDLVIGGAQNPWILRRRESWWADDAGGAYNEWLRQAWVQLSRYPLVSIRGGDNTDL